MDMWKNFGITHLNPIVISYFKFAVKPTEKSKADDSSATYRGFFILKKDGSVNSAYCLCKGGYVFSFDF